MNIPFLKMQAAGNDFVVVDARDGVQLGWSSLAQLACHRHFGVGADGLLVIEASHLAEARMRMFNPDGTEDMCGNGARCVAWRLSKGQAGNLQLETRAGILTLTVWEYGVVTVVLPSPSFRAADLPATVSSDSLWGYPLELEGVTFSLFGVSTGTPHIMHFLEDSAREPDFEYFAPMIEQHPMFPERASVSWVRHAGKNSLHVRVWERGAGETLSCGTGACAVAAVARKRGLTESYSDITMKGGQLRVELLHDESMALTGPTEIVFSGTFYDK